MESCLKRKTSSFRGLVLFWCFFKYVVCDWKFVVYLLIFYGFPVDEGAPPYVKKHTDLISNHTSSLLFSCFLSHPNPPSVLFWHFDSWIWSQSAVQLKRGDWVIFHAVDIRFEISSSHPGTLSSLNQACVKGAGGGAVLYLPAICGSWPLILRNPLQ